MNQTERNKLEALLRDMGEPISYEEIAHRLGRGLASTLMEMVQNGLIIEHAGSPKRYALR